jgi:hypothetical protein
LPKGTVDRVRAELDAAIPAALETLGGLAGNTLPEALITSLVRGVEARHESLNLDR